MEIVHKRKFRAWLKAKPPRAKVGDARYLNCCPVANFLRDTDTLKTEQGYTVDAQVAPSYVEVEARPSDKHRRLPYPIKHIYSIPRWLPKFLDSVDALGHGTSVSAQRALKLLDRC